MQKGFSVPLLLVVISLLVALPLLFWVSANNFNSSLASEDNVKGASTESVTEDHDGFSVNVKSPAGGWSLLQFLCKTTDECSASLDSGQKIATANGGTGTNVVNLYYTPEWDNYSYFKLYVKNSNDKELGDYKVGDLGKVPGAQIVNFSDDGRSYQVVLVPLSLVRNDFYVGPSYLK